MTVTATTRHPSEDVTLTDGVNTVALQLVDPGSRKLNPLAISRSAYPRQATQIAENPGQYTSRNLPYRELVQEDWSGGRALAEFERDTTRYMDGNNVDTQWPNQVTLGGLATVVSSTSDYNVSASISYYDAGDGGADRWFADKFVKSGTETVNGVYIPIRYVGTGGNAIEVTIRSDNSGNPGTVLATSDGFIGQEPSAGVSSDIVRYFRFATPVALTNGVTYWIVIYDETSIGYPAVATEYDFGITGASGNAKDSTDGSSWSATSDDLWFRFGNIINNPYRLFEYRDAVYVIVDGYSATDPSRLYIVGDRGVASASTSTTLEDTNKYWRTNQWANAIVKIIRGTGSDQDVPWRTISSNDTDTLTVTPAWDIAPSTDSEFVIIKTTELTEIIDITFDNKVTDVAVADNLVYFAQAGGANIWRYTEQVVSGYISREAVQENVSAERLLAIQNPNTGRIRLWGSQNDNTVHGSVVWSADVPPAWGDDNDGADLFYEQGALAPTDVFWHNDLVTNVTQSLTDDGIKFTIAAGFTTGQAGYIGLSSPVNIRYGNKIGMYIKSSVATSAGDLQLLYSDQENIGAETLAAAVLIQKHQVAPTEMYWYNGTTFYPIENMGSDNSNYAWSDGSISTTDAIYIGHTSRYERIAFTFTTPNTNAATMSVSSWDGHYWAAFGTFTDGTLAGGTDTFGQDGEVSYDAPVIWDKGTDIAATSGEEDLNQSLYWTKITVSATLSSVIIKNILLRVYNVARGKIDEWTSLNYTKDGDTGTFNAITFASYDYLYIIGSSKYDTVNVNMGSVVNAVSATMTAQYFDGEQWQSLTLAGNTTVSSGKPLAQDGAITFAPPDDWQLISIGEISGYAVRLITNTSLTPSIQILEISTEHTYKTLNIPALVANTPTWVELSLTHVVGGAFDEGNIRSVALNVATDNGAQVVDIYGDIILIAPGIEWVKVGNSADRILGLEKFGIQISNPWVRTETALHEIQTENSNAVVPIPLGELSTLRGSTNLLASCTNDVWLYFGVGPHLERYFNGTLEDVGPNRDEGLPSDRQGDIISLLSYAGRVYAAVDGGSSGYSSVLVRRGSGWHEVWRATAAGDRVRWIQYQNIPGLQYGYMWIAYGNNLAWVPVSSVNPLHISGYPYAASGTLITGWFSAGLLDISKLFSDLKLYTEDLADNAQEIAVSYQKEDGALGSGWTALASEFNTSPFQSRALSATYNVAARRIRLKFTFSTTSSTKTPVLKASILSTLIRLPVKWRYSMYVLLGDNVPNKQGRQSHAKVEVDQAILDTWGDAPTVLTMRCAYSPFDNKLVVIEPTGMTPMTLKLRDNQEVHYAQIDLLEV